MVASPPIAAPIFSWDPLKDGQEVLPDGTPGARKVIQGRRQVRTMAQDATIASPCLLRRCGCRADLRPRTDHPQRTVVDKPLDLRRCHDRILCRNAQAIHRFVVKDK